MNGSATRAPIGANTFQVHCMNAFDDRFAEEWDALLEESSANTIFLTSGWLRAWHETLGQNEPLLIPHVRVHGRLVAAAAFHWFKGVVQFCGTGPSDYSDFLISISMSQESHKQLIHLILTKTRKAVPKFRYFKLGRFQPNSQTLQAIAGTTGPFLATVIGRMDAPMMDMSVVDDRIRKKSLRRHERALQGQGTLQTDTETRAQSILPQLAEFFDQHVERWKSSGERSPFRGNEFRNFYRRVTERLDATGQLRFTTLRLDGALVASHFGFLHGGHFIWYKPTFDPALAKLSPGEVLIKKLLEQAKAEGASAFDFTVGNEAFKLRFATDVRRVVYLYVNDSALASMARRLRVNLVEGTRRIIRSPHWSRLRRFLGQSPQLHRASPR